MLSLKRVTGAVAGRGGIRPARRKAAGGQRGARAWPAPQNLERLVSEQAAVDYLRGVAADLRYWYRSAEGKAQLVLTVNGLFLTFLTTSVLASRSEITQTTAVFGAETWVFLAGMSLCLALSILSAVTCLASRGLGRAEFRALLEHHRLDPDRPETYSPELTSFFYPLTALKASQLAERMLTADHDFIVRALASEIVAFSPHILAKHRWVNRAFILTGLTLGFFLCTGVSYLLRTHLATVHRGH